MSKNALLIFTKNPVYGKVKTRLAATVGNDKALEVYKELIQYTYSATQEIDTHKIVFYDEAIEENDIWKDGYKKQVQQGDDLGEKMMNAFIYAFNNNCNNVVIIGTDCAELTASIINKAFEQLYNYDVVIGPAADGGYYLLGMKNTHNDLFENIQWSSPTVLLETIQRCKENSLHYFLLKELHDVDKEQDLIYMKHIL